ncbi:S1C family serine protease [Halorientalis marina]|jgi:S1-C subfamily serine protease|uniref:S1C family serine protease n=1 Tax=Halorientalis marina TaxID=2931976 RepID=UPI001FF3B84A|nr:trypsin-like peptidase domain-containing protein [Halorientalis marina]
MGFERPTRRRFLAAAGLAAGVAGCNAPNSGPEGRTDLVNSTPESPSVYADVYRDTIDSVVLVRVFTEGGRSGQGSGFVYDGQHIVTNEHVVADASEVQVRFTDGSWQAADVVGKDVYSDLAVVQIDEKPSRATPLELIEGEVAIGQEVVAIGNPLGLSGSISSGIVSGVDRTLPAANNFSIPDAIQTDAAVNPGNSGGPLMTLDGRVAGIINSGSGDNIGFAISAALMRRVVPALISDGEYEHAYMGVRLTDVTPLIAEANDLSNARGVYMDEIVDDGPADGVLQGSTGTERINGTEAPVGGDVVVRMGGEPIRSQQVLSTYLALSTSPGDTIPVEVIRDGSRTTVQLTLGSRPDP